MTAKSDQSRRPASYPYIDDVSNRLAIWKFAKPLDPAERRIASELYHRQASPDEAARRIALCRIAEFQRNILKGK